MAKLEIRLLGRFAVVSETGPIELKARPAQLLAYLALTGGRTIPRTRASGALWPELPEERARANLSTVAWRLRGALESHGHPAGVLVATATSVGLNMDLCEVDVEQFRRGVLRPGQTEAGLEHLSRTIHALQHYKGDLLEDWDVEWCQLERENLKQCLVSSLQALAEGFARRGRQDLAVEYARRAAEADPFNEPAQRSFMKLLIRTGDKAAAVGQFRRFARLARSELGVEPDAETISLLAEMKRPAHIGSVGNAQIPAAPAIQPERAPLMGRSDERQVTAALLDAAIAGSGKGILLVGEAGIGKSRFAEWVAEEWAARGGATLLGRSIEFNEPVPYQPVLDALGVFVDSDDVARFVGRDGSMLPASSLDDAVGSTGDPSPWPPGKLRLFHWLQAPLEEASRKRPMLVMIEDLQWADTGTVDFLSHLLERARHMRVVVLLTARPVGTRPLHDSNLGRLSRHCTAVLRLGPLSEVETGELIRVLFEGHRLSSNLVVRIFTESEGNPLFVIETLRLLQQQPREPLSNRFPGLGPVSPLESDLGIPDGVRTAVQQRLILLDPAARQVAEIASVLGRSFDEELLATVSKGSRNRLSRSIGCLLKHGIFQRENAGYRFSHDKIRAICYESLPVHLRRMYHGRAATGLMQWPDVPTHRLAWHQHSAGQWNSAAASWAQAGDQARGFYAYEEAVQAYKCSIACVRRDVTRGSGDKILDEVLLLAKTDEVLDVLGRPEDRVVLLGRMGALCRRHPEPPLLSVWLTRSALLQEHFGRFDLAAGLARRAWVIARAARNMGEEAQALRVLAWMLNRAGRHRRSLAVFQLALRRTGNVNAQLRIAILRQAATVHAKTGNYAAAAACLQSARSILAGLDENSEAPFVSMTEAIVLKWTGNLTASRANLLGGLRFAEEIHDPVTAARVTLQLATLDALEASLGNAVRRLRKARVSAQTTGHPRTVMACRNEIANSVGRLMGNYNWAWDASKRALELSITSGNSLLVAVCKDSQAQLHLDHHNADAAEELVDEVLRLFDREGHSGDPYGPFLESLAKRGIIALLRGDHEQAVASLEQARDIQTRVGERLMLPDTLSHLALAYAGLRDPDRALATSNEALKLLAEIGHANLQPQRIFWHHFRILAEFNREPRLPFLCRAVEFIAAQAATLSQAQQVRLRRDVPLNREILTAWERHGHACEPAASTLAS
jgi:DNA-binding SARP family transcriptional activator